MSQRNVTTAITNHHATVERKAVLLDRPMHHPGRRLAALTTLIEVRAPVPPVDNDPIVGKLPRDLVVHHAHRSVVEISTRDTGLVRHDDRRKIMLAQQPQRLSDGRQNLNTARIAEKPPVLDNGPIAIEKNRRPHQ